MIRTVLFFLIKNISVNYYRINKESELTFSEYEIKCIDIYVQYVIYLTRIIFHLTLPSCKVRYERKIAFQIFVKMVAERKM